MKSVLGYQNTKNAYYVTKTICRTKMSRTTVPQTLGPLAICAEFQELKNYRIFELRRWTRTGYHFSVRVLCASRYDTNSLLYNSKQHTNRKYFFVDSHLLPWKIDHSCPPPCLLLSQELSRSIQFPKPCYCHLQWNRINHRDYATSSK